MNNKNSVYFLIICLLILAITLSAGCITLTKKPTGGTKTPPPVTAPATAPPASGGPLVKSFTALPESLNAGQQSQLKWEVTGATKVDITPIVGTVQPASSVMVSPTATTTYTLSASNSAGATSATVTVTVKGSAGTPAAGAAGKADIVVTNLSLVGSNIYYTTKNTGSEPTKGCYSFFYVNGQKEAQDYTEALQPGQERINSFSNYGWRYSVADDEAMQASRDAPRQFMVKVCADAENTVVENDEANNCIQAIWGIKYNYRFADFAHQAVWYTNDGRLILPTGEDNSKGYAGVKNVVMNDGQSYGNAILTYPAKVANGWIKGGFPEFGSSVYGTTGYYWPLFEMARFNALVGFTREAAPGSKAKVLLQLEDETHTIIFSWFANIAADGKVLKFDADLSKFAGKNIAFWLRVENQGPAEQCFVGWVEPTLSQP